MYACDAERDCLQADGDQPVRGWATSHDSVHDVLVDKKSKAMLVFILFSRAMTSFKYLGSVMTDGGSKPEILSRIAQATAALTWLKPVWNDWSIFLPVPRYDCCTPLSHPSSCMLLNHAPSQQSSTEEYKP